MNDISTEMLSDSISIDLKGIPEWAWCILIVSLHIRSM